MITNTQVREAKSRDRKYEITCDGLPGFVLRVLPSGKKVFFARYRDPLGKDHRQRLGLMTPSFGVDEARKAAMIVLAQQGVVASGSAPAAAGPVVGVAPSGGPKAPTIREFARRFEQDHVDMYMKPRSAAKYRSVLRLYIIPEFGERRLDEVTPADVQRVHNKLKSVPCAANYMRSVLSVMYSKWALWDSASYRNPAAVVRRFDERQVERYLTPEERQRLERVLAQAARISSGKPGHVGREAIWGIRLLMLTGMRRDEIRDLRWEHVAWRQKMLRLEDSKTGKRDVVVSDEVMVLLGEIAAAQGNPKRGLVVGSKRGRKLYSLDRSWARARSLAGLDDVRLHDFRHSVASDAIMNGVPLEVVGKMLGHKNYRTTQRYAHIADSVLRDAVNLTSEIIVRAGRSGTKAKRPMTKQPRSRSRR